MTGTTKAPDPQQGQVADAVTGNWVDTLAPPVTRPYLRLSRADRPIGTWLLLLPCWWAVLLSAASKDALGWNGLWIMLGCTIGAFLMRGAGCTWNDITDRNIDGSVERTRSRPIPSGQVTVKQALVWMCLQALVAFAILLTFNTGAIALGVLSLALVCIYPFAKRFTWWPQVFLGLAFNWGALLAWVAHDGHLGWPAIWLYVAGIFWTLFYDTIYAYQDSEDDALIGVKSTARLFGENSQKWLNIFHVAAVVCLGIATVAALQGQGSGTLAIALSGVIAFALHLGWQSRILDIKDPDVCLKLFRSNRNAGLLIGLFFAAAILL